MSIFKDKCQFEYKVASAIVTCPKCGQGTAQYPNERNVIEDFKCAICGSNIEIPHHYAYIYHNKNCRVKVK